MKRLLFALIMILPIVGMSQIEFTNKVSSPVITVVADSGHIKFAGEVYVKSTIFTEWSKYLTDCNKLVPDSIRQSGTVKCELVPVRLNGKIVSYSQNPIDTVWNKCECDEYKAIDFSGLSVSTAWMTNGSSVTLGYSFSEPESAKNTFTIERNKICQIKKRKATFEDFFERWCVEQKLIKLN